MRKPKDTILTHLAHDAGKLRFDDTQADAFRTANAVPGASFRNCYFNGRAKCWEVILFLGGTRQRIGVFDEFSGYHATRFASAATYYFWKFRKVKKACSDSDLIYGVEQAKTDVDKCINLLVSIQGRLIDSDVFKVGEQAESELADSDIRSAIKSHIRTWRSYVKSWRRLSVNFSGPAGKLHREFLDDSINKHSNLIIGIHKLRPTE